MFRCISVLFLLFACTHHANALQSPLEQWLSGTVAPTLAKKLEQHPKFRGEVIRLSAMQSGRLTEKSNDLVRMIERDLTVRLMRYDGVRIHYPGKEFKPSDRPVHYVLGVDVHKHHRFEHRVTVAMVDLNEGIWMGGTAFRWQGRLSRTEQQLLGNQATTQRASTRQSPTRDTSARTRPVALSHARTEPAALLSALTYKKVAPEGACQGWTDSVCVEVQVPLQQHANLLVFAKRHSEVIPACNSGAVLRSPGIYHFRLPVTAQRGTRADADFYAIATQDPGAAASLRYLLQQACSKQSPLWQVSFNQALEKENSNIQWQVLRLRQSGRSVRAL